MSLTFRCRKFDLQNQLDAIATAVDKKSKDEIYSCVYMARTDATNLLLAAASRDLMVTTSIKIDAGGGLLAMEPVAAGSNIAMAVQAEKLLALCKKLPDKIIEFTYDPKLQRAAVRCDSSHFTLSCQEPTFFPAITAPKVENYRYKIPVRFMHAAITRCLDMITLKESPMVYFSGALLILEDKVLEVITTDGNRLAVSYTTMETEEKMKVILPKKILMELAGNLENSQLASLNFDLNDNHAFFNFGKFTYRTAILAGSFPNYKLITDSVRANNDIQFRMNRAKLLTAIERCLVFVGKEAGFGINLEFKEKEATLGAANSDGDSAFEIIEAECSRPLKVRLNGQYVLQYLNTVSNDDTVDLWANSKQTMGAIYMRGQSERNYLWIAQPMELL
jgi:DNA polymerase III subunit beta